MFRSYTQMFFFNYILRFQSILQIVYHRTHGSVYLATRDKMNISLED